MIWLAIGLTILGTIFAASGQIALKFAAPRMSISMEGTLNNYPFLLGLFFYGMSMILCIVALKWGPLSILNPLGACNYIWATFLAMKLLNEKVNKWKVIGIIMIIIGVVIIVQ